MTKKSGFTELRTIGGPIWGNKDQKRKLAENTSQNKIQES